MSSMSRPFTLRLKEVIHLKFGGRVLIGILCINWLMHLHALTNESGE